MPDHGPNLPSPILATFAGLSGIAGVLLAGGLAFLQAPPAAAPTASAPAPAPCPLRPEGHLRGRFFGGLDMEVDWSGAGMTCDGMRKPDKSGVRLHFSGNQPGHGPLELVIGINGDIDGIAGAERPANVTVVDGADGRFFSTAGTGRCWARMASAMPQPGQGARRGGTRLEGLVYCVGALPEVGGQSSLTLGDLYFAGLVSPDEE